MSQSRAEFDELGQLAAALCDCELAPGEAARLEQLVVGSDSACRYFLEYMQLHGELCWEIAASSKPVVAEGPIEVLLPRASRPWSVKRMSMRWAIAASLLVALTAGALTGYWAWVKGGPGHASVARLGRSLEAEWSDGAAPNGNGNVSTGRKLVIAKGLTEVVFQCGASVILEGPATFEVQSATSGLLSRGQLTAHTPPEAAGFTIHTPNATIIDQGTEFGVAVHRDGKSDIEVFAGRVEVGIGDATENQGPKQLLGKGEALRVSTPVAGGTPQAEKLPAGGRHFARSLGGSVSRLEELVAATPDLIHHYTFEGATGCEKRLDCRGDFHLDEVSMCEGDGGGKINYTASGPDPYVNAVRPFRGPQLGNTHGMGLQSQQTFRPPRTMTVELLLSFDRPKPVQDGLIAAAVATRENRNRCGFLVAAVDNGRLVHMLDGRAPWLESGVELVPGHWYYVASTFQAQGESTIVNTYLADIHEGERTLRWVVRNQSTPGVAGTGPLGIGKGFDGENANAYPWAGALDEIAIYGAALDRDTLQSHLEALTAPPPAEPATGAAR